MNFLSFSIYKFIILGLLLFLIFRVIKFLISVLIKRNKLKKISLKYLPVVEFTFWFLFLTWTFKSFLDKNEYFAIGLFAVMMSIALWGTWLLLKDYIAGLIIKTDSDFSEGETITIDELTGNISKLKFRTAQIETEKGKIVQIPYSQILKTRVIKSDTAKTISAYTFEIEVDKKNDLKELIQNIKTAILYLPWSSLKKDPIIKIFSETEKHFVLELTVYSLKKEFFFNIKSFIKKKFSI